MQKLNINVSLIDKSELYEGKKGKYLSLTLFENRDGTDQYGNDGFIVQEISRERRENGEKGPIIGNWKHHGRQEAPRDRSPAGDRKRAEEAGRPSSQRPERPTQPDDETDDIPF